MIRKFRAWDFSENKKYWNNWSDGYLLSLEGVLLKTQSGDAGEIECIVPCEKRLFDFEQSIGRCDKNQHELYEGDRVKAEIGDKTVDGEIQWSDDRLGWVLETDEGGIVDIPMSHFLLLIGNIHEGK